MAFCLVVGTKEFTSQLKSAPPNFQARCNNCGNFAARAITRWPWFTVCFLPLIPLSTHKYEELACPVCNFHQDLKTRPDVQEMIRGGGQGMPPGPPGPGQGGYNMPNHAGGPKPQYA